MDSFEKFTSCVRRYINLVTQEKKKGLLFYTQYDKNKNIFRYPKYSMIFSCPEGSPEKLEPYSYMSKEKVLFGVISNFTDEIKKRNIEQYIELYVVYKFDSGDCHVYLVNKSNELMYDIVIPYILLRSSDDSHKVLSKDIILNNYEEFFNIMNKTFNNFFDSLVLGGE